MENSQKDNPVQTVQPFSYTAKNLFQNPFQKFLHKLTSLGFKKIISIFVILFIIVAVFITVILTGQNQDIRQRATGTENILATINNDMVNTTIDHNPELRENKRAFTPTFSTTPVTSIGKSGQTFTLSQTRTTRLSHAEITTGSNAITITHKFETYQRWQHLTPTYLENQSRQVTLTLACVISSTPYVRGSFPTMARVQADIDGGASSYYLEPGRSLLSFVVPQGKSVDITFRVLNASADFTGCQLLKNVDENIWATSGVFHNNETGDTPASRPNLSSGRLHMEDDPRLYGLHVCIPVNRNIKYKATATVRETRDLSGYPGGHSVQAAELTGCGLLTFTGTTGTNHARNEEFYPSTGSVGLTMVTLNGTLTVSNYKLEEVEKRYSAYIPNRPEHRDNILRSEPRAGAAPLIEIYNSDGTRSQTINLLDSPRSSFLVRKGQSFFAIHRVINMEASFHQIEITSPEGITESLPASVTSDFPLRASGIYQNLPYQKEYRFPPEPLRTKYTLSGTINSRAYLAGYYAPTYAELKAQVYNANGSLDRTYIPVETGRTSTVNGSNEIIVERGQYVVLQETAINARAQFSNVQLTKEILELPTSTPTTPPAATATSAPDLPIVTDCRHNDADGSVTIGQDITYTMTVDWNGNPVNSYSYGWSNPNFTPTSNRSEISITGYYTASGTRIMGAVLYGSHTNPERSCPAVTVIDAPVTPTGTLTALSPCVIRWGSTSGQCQEAVSWTTTHTTAGTITVQVEGVGTVLSSQPSNGSGTINLGTLGNNIVKLFAETRLLDTKTVNVQSSPIPTLTSCTVVGRGGTTALSSVAVGDPIDFLMTVNTAAYTAANGPGLINGYFTVVKTGGTATFTANENSRTGISGSTTTLRVPGNFTGAGTFNYRTHIGYGGSLAGSNYLQQVCNPITVIDAPTPTLTPAPTSTPLTLSCSVASGTHYLSEERIRFTASGTAAEDGQLSWSSSTIESTGSSNRNIVFEGWVRDRTTTGTHTITVTRYGGPTGKLAEGSCTVTVSPDLASERATTYCTRTQGGYNGNCVAGPSIADDLTFWIQEIQKSSPSLLADYNGDGRVNTLDFNLWSTKRYQ